MSGISISEVNARINGEWGANAAYYAQIMKVVDNTQASFTVNNEIRIIFRSNHNHQYTLIFQANVEITRDKIRDRRGASIVLDRTL
jgi:hypothetical protein